MEIKAGLEALKVRTTDDWLTYLERLDATSKLETTDLKAVWQKFTDAAIRDYMRFDPVQAYMGDYNRMKLAFDKFAEWNKLPKWKFGVASDEWLGP